MGRNTPAGNHRALKRSKKHIIVLNRPNYNWRKFQTYNIFFVLVSTWETTRCCDIRTLCRCAESPLGALKRLVGTPGV